MVIAYPLHDINSELFARYRTKVLLQQMVGETWMPKCRQYLLNVNCGFGKSLLMQA